MQLLLLTIVAIAVIMAAMAVGVILGDRTLRGSCGGPPVLGPDGDPLTCPDCNCQAAANLELSEPTPTEGSRASASG